MAVGLPRVTERGKTPKVAGGRRAPVAKKGTIRVIIRRKGQGRHVNEMEIEILLEED